MAWPGYGCAVLPACQRRRSPPPPTASGMPASMSGRSPAGSAAASAGTWPSPPAPPAPTSWTSTSTAKPGTATRLRQAPARGPGRRRVGLCANPDRRDARLLHRLRPAQRPPAQPPPGLPLQRRLHRGPALPGRRPAYWLIAKPGGRGRLDWAAVTRFLEPQRSRQRPAPGQAPDRALSQLARWVASQPEGNRNSGLYWAANRALDADPAADLSPLAAAARQAGLDEPEITRTLDSARRTSHQAEAVN